MENNIPAEKKAIVALYNSVAPVFDSTGPSIFSYIGRRLVEVIGIAEGAQVLDIATGRGANLLPAAEKVGPHGHVTGIDLAETMVQETAADIQRRNIQNATVQHMDAEHLSFSDASFDVVLCGFAIFWFPHPEQAASECFRVLRPGGKFGVTAARNLSPLQKWYGKRLTEYHEKYHFPLRPDGHSLDLAEIPVLLERTGFIGIQVLHETKDFVYTDEQEWWESLWTHGPRYSLERMPPEVLEAFKSEVFARLAIEKQPDGIHEEMDIQYIIGTKGGL